MRPAFPGLVPSRGRHLIGRSPTASRTISVLTRKSRRFPVPFAPPAFSLARAVSELLPIDPLGNGASGSGSAAIPMPHGDAIDRYRILKNESFCCDRQVLGDTIATGPLDRCRLRRKMLLANRAWPIDVKTAYSSRIDRRSLGID